MEAFAMEEGARLDGEGGLLSPETQEYFVNTGDVDALLVEAGSVGKRSLVDASSIELALKEGVQKLREEPASRHNDGHHSPVLGCLACFGGSVSVEKQHKL